MRIRQKMTREELNKLIDKYLSSQASPEEARLIDDFFDAQERKQTLPHYRLSEEMWTSIEEKIQTTPDFTIGKSEKRISVGGKEFPIRKILVPLIFIVTLGIAGVVSYLNDGFTSNTSKAWVTSESPKGQKSIITLADGSSVYLNSASSISYPETFEADKREIMLSGEAFFEVTRDEKRPFIVRSGNLITRVLGTSFNVQAFEGQNIRVTVATGKVQVETKKDPKSKDVDYVILVTNQQAIYDAQAGLLTKTVDIDQFLAWKNHILYFDSNTLEEVATRLERWYNVSIEFENEKIKYCRINGQYKDMNLNSVLKSIQYMYQIDYKFSNQNNIKLYGKGCDQ